MKKTDPPRTGLSGYQDGTTKLPPDDNDEATLASTAFGQDNPGNSDSGIPVMMDS